MTVHKFLVISLVVFLVGLAVLYTGGNRVPFRQQGGTHEKHQSYLPGPVEPLAAGITGNKPESGPIIAKRS